MTNESLILTLFLFLGVAPASALAGHVYVYRWVDPVDNEIHYSDTAPDSSPSDMVAIDPAPPYDASLHNRLSKMADQAREFVDEQKHERAARRLALALEQARKQSCQQQQQWLAQLESRPGPKLIVVDANGVAQRMTESDRQAKMVQARQQIAQTCQAKNAGKERR